MSQKCNLIDLSVNNIEVESKSDIRCQKCLEFGHWTYKCTEERKYLFRESRSAVLERKLRQAERFGLTDKTKPGKGDSDSITNDLATNPTKLQILAEATALELEALIEKEKHSKRKIGPKNIFTKNVKIEALKEQLKNASKKTNFKSNSNEKYLEATANLEALAYPSTGGPEKGEVNKIFQETNQDETSNCSSDFNPPEKKPEEKSHENSSSLSSSSFDDTDTTLISTSSSDSADESYENYSKSSKQKNSNMNKRKRKKKVKSYFIIPSSKIGIVLGKGQETIKNISDTSETHCTLYKKTSNTAKETKIIIRGTRDAVRRAKSMIMEVLYVPYEGQYTDYITISANKCGIIIGKGGEVIKYIKEKTGARCDIDMNKWNRGRDKYVIIRGTAESVDIAKDMIMRILDKDKKATVEDFIIVPTKKLGLVIGKGGETIKAITKETKVFCELDKDGATERRERKMFIKGKKDAIKKAKQVILEIMYAPKEGEYTDFISVPVDMCGLIIGKKGETIKEINQLSNAFCEIDANVPGDSLEKHVIIQGSVQAIEKAKKLIKEKLNLLYPHERMCSNSTRCSTSNSIERNTRQAPSTNKKSKMCSTPLTSESYNKYFIPERASEQKMPNTQAQNKTTVTSSMDYSKEWAEYYRSMGMLSEAQEIEKSS